MSATPTAYHEAGHAVAFLAHGEPFRYVSVSPGAVERHDAPIPALVMARVAAAGPIAAAHAAGTDPRDELARGGCADAVVLADATDDIACGTGGDPSVICDRIWIDAVGLVGELWPGIERVAVRLTRVEQISYDEVVRITQWSRC